MSYLYRCNKCKQRRSLPRLHTDYVYAPKCKSCGAPLTYRDKWQERKNKVTACTCDGYPFPHRKGSGVWCIHSVKQPTDMDYQDRRYAYV